MNTVHRINNALAQILALLNVAAAAVLCGLLALLINIRDLLAESLRQRGGLGPGRLTGPEGTPSGHIRPGAAAGGRNHPQGRSKAEDGAAHRQPRLPTHDQALRPQAGGDLSGRSRENRHLTL